MSRLLEITGPVTLYSADRYPRSTDEVRRMGLSGGRNEEMRAMTIAAFRVAQNNTQLSQQYMDVELLDFLAANSASAVGHWEREGRLLHSGQRYQLTPTGITECQNTLLGLSGPYSTTESKVQEWIDRMLDGGGPAIRSRVFNSSYWTT